MIDLYAREWHKKALQLKLENKSNRQISREIWGYSDNESLLRRFFNRPDVKEILGKVESKPDIKVLFWDIETAPNKSYHWDWYGLNIPVLSHNIELGFMLSHAWQWGIDGEVHSSTLTRDEVLRKDDGRLVLEMHTLFNNADIIIAHNGKKFDIKKANASFARFGLTPPTPYKVVDTVRISKKFFNLPSHSLAFLCKYLDLGVQKVEHEGFGLWVKCYEGDQDSLDKMAEYNRGDIPTLVNLYKVLRSWGNDGVDISALVPHKGLICPTCGSSHVSDTEKQTLTGKKLHKVYKCLDCKSHSKLHETSMKNYLSKI